MTVEAVQTTEKHSEKEPEKAPGGKTSKIAANWWKWTILIVAVIYAMSWLPALFFYLEFQRLIMGFDPNSPNGSLLITPLKRFSNISDHGAEASSTSGTIKVAEAKTAPSPREGWMQVAWEGALLMAPPGGLQGISREKETLALEYDGGKVLIDRFPPGTIRSMFFEEFRRLGGKAEKLPRALLILSDEDLLEQICQVTLEHYQFGMSGVERTLYATKVLVKMLLWHLDKVEESLLLAGKNSKGVLMRGSGGEVRAIIAAQPGIFIFQAPKNFPAAWQQGADLLLEILPANDELLSLWRSQVREHHPENHPLSRWAFDSAGGK